MTKIIPSPIVYMGSKRRILPKLMPLFPKDIDKLYDVFGGSGVISLNVPSKSIYLNEYSPLVSALQRHYLYTDVEDIRKRLRELEEKYQLVGENGADGYYKMRSYFNETVRNGNPDITMLPVILRYAYMGLVNTNKKGEFNTPFIRRKKPVSETFFVKIKNFQDTLRDKDITLTQLDFRNVDVSALTPSDFVYVDPPYLLTCANYNDKWGVQEELDLYHWLSNLHKRGVPFGLSNVVRSKGKENEYLKEFMADYTTYSIPSNYKINLVKHLENIEVTKGDVYVTNLQEF